LDFYKFKRPLPCSPNPLLDELNITIPVNTKEDADILIKRLRKDFRFNLPLGSQWIASSISQTGKEKLPINISDADKSLELGTHMDYRSDDFLSILRKLRNRYEFNTLPDHWFKIFKSPLPFIAKLNKYFENSPSKIYFLIKDDDDMPSTIALLHKKFDFNKLPDNYILSEDLLKPGFDLTPFIC